MARRTVMIFALLLFEVACAKIQDDTTRIKPVYIPSPYDAAPPTYHDASVAPPPKDPVGLPAGWSRVPNFEPHCQFFRPDSAATRPGPMTWKPCPADAFEGTTCEMEDSIGLLNELGFVRPIGFATDASGVSRLVLRASDHDWSYELFVRTDGAVDQALLMADVPICSPEITSIVDDHWVWSVRAPIWADGTIGGAPLDAAPSFVLQRPPGNYHYAYASPWGSIEDDSTGLVLHRWDTGALLSILTPDSGHPNPKQVVVTRDAVFFSADFDVSVWTPTTGKRTFLVGHADDDRPAAFASDGHDLVWAYGSGQDGAAFTNVDIFTAPYTTNPGALASRKLRAEPDFAARSDTFHVGCGYAAFDVSSDTRVMRLSDGVTWTLPRARSVGVTCDEVFLHVARVTDGSYEEHAMRVRLDSLGPGTPPGP